MVLSQEVTNDIVLKDCCCAICKDILRVPVTLRCGHSFCGQCIWEWVIRFYNRHHREAKKGECAICRDEFDLSYFANIVTNKQLEALILNYYLPILKQHSMDAEYLSNLEIYRADWIGIEQRFRDLGMAVKMGSVWQYEKRPPPNQNVQPPPIAFGDADMFELAWGQNTPPSDLDMTE